MQKRSRKGFTLAELLIVVAIIAVLVAIAVPLFVSSLSKAEKAKKDANLRAVKSAAVVYILSLEEGDADYANIYTGGVMAEVIKATATVAANGDISGISVTKAKETDKTDGKYVDGFDSKDATKATVYITPVDVDPDPAVGP